MAPPPPLLIDGETGEGGGQLVRMAIALSAITGRAIKIINIRANRPARQRRNQGGLKNQHIAAIRFLADATAAKTSGLSAGSKTLTFVPTLAPTSLHNRTLEIAPKSSASSATLILQAILPYLLFAASGGEPVEITIKGGTNTSKSPSFEYVDQVLIPALEDRFGVIIERELRKRGWMYGPTGCIWVRVSPVEEGATLVPTHAERHLADPSNFEVQAVDVSIAVPLRLHAALQTALARDIAAAFPSASVTFRVTEDSGHPSRSFVLLVAKSATGLRWGSDALWDYNPKDVNPEPMAKRLSASVVEQLAWELGVKGEGDFHLQDQLVCFQALAAGRSSFLRRGGEEGSHARSTATQPEDVVGGEMREEDASEPFGHGSRHAQTVRWVAARMLPGVRFFNGGDAVEGAGVKCGEETVSWVDGRR